MLRMSTIKFTYLFDHPPALAQVLMIDNDIFNSIKAIGKEFDDWFNLKPGFFESVQNAKAAYPVPSTSSYAKCLKDGGKSVWTSDGWWRCLLKGEKAPENLIEFTDYTSFLEYQRKLVNDKRLVSQIRETSTKMLEDGKYETKTKVTREFADGSVEVKEY